jgi:hypothetical protein
VYVAAAGHQQALETMLDAAKIDRSSNPNNIISQAQWNKVFPEKPVPNTIGSILFHLRNLFKDCFPGFASILSSHMSHLWDSTGHKNVPNFHLDMTDMKCNKSDDLFKGIGHLCPTSHTRAGCIQYHSKNPQTSIGKRVASLGALFSLEALSNACSSFQERVGKACQGKCTKGGERDFNACGGMKKVYFEEFQPRMAIAMYEHLKEEGSSMSTEAVKYTLLDIILCLLNIKWAQLAAPSRQRGGSSQ